MNLPLRWVDYFTQRGFISQHWSQVGDPKARDSAIMAWAQSNNAIVFTHDLDFGAILATTRASGPSVIQVRTQTPLPEVVGDTVVHALKQFHDALVQGALITIDPDRQRVRLLPIRP